MSFIEVKSVQVCCDHCKSKQETSVLHRAQYFHVAIEGLTSTNSLFQLKGDYCNLECLMIALKERIRAKDQT